MQLFAEVRDVLAMLLCGFLGYMLVQWLKTRATVTAQCRQKLKGLCETTAAHTAARTATAMKPSDLAASGEVMKQPNHQQPNSHTEHVRNRKAIRKPRKTIHPAAAYDELRMAGDVPVDNSRGTTATANVDIQRLAENLPTTGTYVADKLPPLVSAETDAGVVQENSSLPADEQKEAGWVCTTMNIDDAEADDEAEAEKSDVGQHMQEQKEEKTKKREDQGTEAEKNRQPEVELPQAAPDDEEQRPLRNPELGEWAEETDDHSSQLQQDDDHLSKEEDRHRVLTSDWADAKDEEDWSESGCEVHHSCLRALGCSASQHGAVEHDIWSMPFVNNQTSTSQSINKWSGKWKQGGQPYNDNWMTPFAPSDGEMPGWFTNDKWFGQGQRGSCGPHLEENDCWMTPFDELIQQTTTHVITSSDASVEPSVSSPIGSAVCSWNAGSCPASEASGDSSGGVGAAEIFTNGRQVFRPVPSATGQQLFTDGKQLYASVCVVVGPPSKAVDPCSPCSTVSFMAEESDED
mmetsp:Transcript_133878/g.267156  ORF Transcript_133878/g.267156 Transcript_133878/m.267156 type:complete len:519 (-) Transcript_133878:226-1782(-)